MAEVEEEIARLEAASAHEMRDDDDAAARNAELDALSQQLVTLNERVYTLSLQHDSKPTQIELNQYQRRFVELYNQCKLLLQIKY